MIKNNMWGNPNIEKVSTRAIEREMDRGELALSKLEVNHILHLLLSIVTAGIWIIAWIITTMSVSSQKSQIIKRINILENTLDERIESNELQPLKLNAA